MSSDEYTPREDVTPENAPGDTRRARDFPQITAARHVPTPPLNIEFNSYARKYVAVKMRLSPKLTPII